MTSWHIRDNDTYNVEGGPAFGHGDHTNGGHPGMSLRDWFAGQVIPSIISSGLPAGTTLGPNSPDNNALVADAAYAIADAMLARRAKGGDA